MEPTPTILPKKHRVQPIPAFRIWSNLEISMSTLELYLVFSKRAYFSSGIRVIYGIQPSIWDRLSKQKPDPKKNEKKTSKKTQKTPKKVNFYQNYKVLNPKNEKPR